MTAACARGRCGRGPARCLRRATSPPSVDRKLIEVGIDVRPAGDRAGDDVGRDGGIGRPVAAVAERDPAMRHVRMRPDDRQACLVSPKALVHANSTVVSSFGKSRCSLRRSISVLRLSIVAFLLVRDALVSAAADHPAVRHCPDIEIGIGRFPDAALARPQAPLLLRDRCDGPCGVDLVIAARNAVGQLVTGRENKLTALDAASVGRRHRHAASLRRDVRHFHRRTRARRWPPRHSIARACFSLDRSRDCHSP